MLYATLLQTDGDCECEGNNYSYLLFWAHNNLQRILPKGQLSFSKVSILNLIGVKEATFSRKNVAVHHIYPFTPLEKPLKINVLCAFRGSFRLCSSCEKRTQCSQLHMAILLCSCRKESGYRNYRPHSIHLMTIRQNVCFRRRVCNLHQLISSSITPKMHTEPIRQSSHSLHISGICALSVRFL